MRVAMESTQHMIHAVDTKIWKRRMASSPLVFSLALISIFGMSDVVPVFRSINTPIAKRMMTLQESYSHGLIPFVTGEYQPRMAKGQKRRATPQARFHFLHEVPRSDM